MNSSNLKLNTKLAMPTANFVIALTATVATVAQPQPASAQILEIVSGALGGLLKSSSNKYPYPLIAALSLTSAQITPMATTSTYVSLTVCLLVRVLPTLWAFLNQDRSFNKLL